MLFLSKVPFTLLSFFWEKSTTAGSTPWEAESFNGWDPIHHGEAPEPKMWR